MAVRSIHRLRKIHVARSTWRMFVTEAIDTSPQGPNKIPCRNPTNENVIKNKNKDKENNESLFLSLSLSPIFSHYILLSFSSFYFWHQFLSMWSATETEAHDDKAQRSVSYNIKLSLSHVQANQSAHITQSVQFFFHSFASATGCLAAEPDRWVSERSSPRLHAFLAAVMRGSCCGWNRRTEQRFRLLAISTVKSVKIKLLLCCCVALTLLAFSTSASSFVLWNNQTPLSPRSSDPRFSFFPSFLSFSLH